MMPSSSRVPNPDCQAPRISCQDPDSSSTEEAVANHGHASKGQEATHQDGFALPVSILRLVHQAVRDRQLDDERALDALLRRIELPVSSHLLRRFRDLPNPEDSAREVTLDVMYRVATGMQDCRAGTDTQAWQWMWTIVERAAIDHFRREMSRPPHVLLREEIEQRLGIDQRGDAHDEPGDSETPGETLLLRHVFECYDTLREESAQLIWHRLVLSASYEQIGRAYGISAAGAKRRWQRACAALKKAVVRRVLALKAGRERNDILIAIWQRDASNADQGEDH